MHRVSSSLALACTLIALILSLALAAPVSKFPVYPFTRELNLANSPVPGTDVYILKNFLTRSQVAPYHGAIDNNWTKDAATALAAFQKSVKASRADGVFDAESAELVLKYLSEDHYVDHGIRAADLGAKYKIFIPVHRNRSIETIGSLYDANNTLLFQFPVRAHGHTNFGPEPWPSYSNSYGLNEFSSNGNTPTGLAWVDLNTPEPDPKLYGPFNVNRVVSGITGNAYFLLPNVRNGILLHTGQWPNWTPRDPMPDSSGCLHAHPDDIKRISDILVNKLGIVAHENPLGKLPYPFQPQGIISIQLVDE